MKKLTIFYDSRCGMCAKFRVWLELQPKRVEVEFLAYDSDEANQRFPSLMALGADRDVVVLADDGRWWQGCGAWLTCLWTTVYFRSWAFRLASPTLQPFVKKVVYLLSENRLTISRLMGLSSERELAIAITAISKPQCEKGECYIR